MSIWYGARTWSANSRISSEGLLVCPAVVVTGLGGRVDISWYCPCCCCLAAVERTTLIDIITLSHNNNTLTTASYHWWTLLHGLCLLQKCRMSMHARCPYLWIVIQRCHLWMENDPILLLQTQVAALGWRSVCSTTINDSPLHCKFSIVLL